MHKILEKILSGADSNAAVLLWLGDPERSVLELSSYRSNVSDDAIPEELKVRL